MTAAIRPDPEALLAHRRFVRRVAARLLADPSDVDDVEQRTWLSALRHAGQAPRELRAWLQRIARNHALDLLRGRSRARTRERAAARPEAIEDVGNVLTRVEGARRLVDSVMTLDEPLREALLLRYYEGESVRAISARLGVSLPAVKGRVRRGLARLRDELDARGEFGPGRTPWRDELAALLVAPSAVPLAVAKLALVGVAVVAAGGVLWKLRSDPAGRTPPAALQATLGDPAPVATRTPSANASVDPLDPAETGAPDQTGRAPLQRGARTGLASAEVTLAIGDALVFGEDRARPDGDRSALDLYVMDIRHGASLACFRGALEASPPLTSVGLPEAPLDTLALIHDAPSLLPARDLWLLERCSADRSGVGFARGLDGRVYKLALVELEGHPEALRRRVRIRYEEVPVAAEGGLIRLPKLGDQPSGAAQEAVQRALTSGARIPGQSFHRYVLGDYTQLDELLPIMAIRPESHVVVETSVDSELELLDGAGLVASGGIGPSGSVLMRGSTALTVLGPMRGNVRVDGYSFLYLGGELEGTLDIESYATVFLERDLRGTLNLRSYATVYFGERPSGILDVEGSCWSTFYFDGFYSDAELANWPGDLDQVTLHVRSSNLPLGEHEGLGTWRRVIVGDPAWETLGR